MVELTFAKSIKVSASITYVLVLLILRLLNQRRVGLAYWEGVCLAYKLVDPDSDLFEHLFSSSPDQRLLILSFLSR